MIELSNKTIKIMIMRQVNADTIGSFAIHRSINEPSKAALTHMPTHTMIASHVEATVIRELLTLIYRAGLAYEGSFMTIYDRINESDRFMEMAEELRAPYKQWSERLAREEVAP